MRLAPLPEPGKRTQVVWILRRCCVPSATQVAPDRLPVCHLPAHCLSAAGEEEFEKQRQALLALKMMKVREGHAGSTGWAA